ncbi:antitoxin HicB [Agrobacterium vitis]|nr:antitoxin HicB [Agrobacterium vitis]
MQYTYKATIETDPDGGFVVTFADVPEAITHGETMKEAVASAREALGLALRGIMQEGRPLPAPVAQEGHDIAVVADVAAKLALIQAFNEAGISKTELARRIGKTENEARRLLDPDHASKIGVMADALEALGQEIVLSVRQAA